MAAYPEVTNSKYVIRTSAYNFLAGTDGGPTETCHIDQAYTFFRVTKAVGIIEYCNERYGTDVSGWEIAHYATSLVAVEDVHA